MLQIGYEKSKKLDLWNETLSQEQNQTITI
jgi:hypothetical protein